MVQNRGVSEEERLKNGLRWIGHLAGTHYLGGAFDPEHMKAIADLCEEVIGGRVFEDFDTAAADALRRGRERHQRWVRMGLIR